MVDPIEDELQFHRRRAAEEQQRAAACANNRHAIFHLTLAELHLRRVEDFDVRSNVAHQPERRVNQASKLR